MEEKDKEFSVFLIGILLGMMAGIFASAMLLMLL